MPNSQTVELFTLYALGVSFTILRTYARIVAVGVRDLRVDDYLIWLAILIYSAQCALGYNVGFAAHGLDNSGMTPAQRSALSPEDAEYKLRLIGAKIQVAGWTSASCLLWTLKLCVAFFYLRLHDGLTRYKIRIYIGIGLIVTTFITLIMTIYLSCRPFNHYWQISPDPGNACQAAVSKPIIWVMFIGNVSTDVYLFVVPLPMLWQSSLKTYKKLAATLVLSGGILIVVCAILKSVFVLVDPVHGGQLAAAWGTRETFIAVITTNLPMVFPLLKIWLKPWLPTTLNSSSKGRAYKAHGSGFVTIGGGGASASGRSRPGQQSRDASRNMTFDNESEEHIVKGGTAIPLQSVGGTQRSLKKNDIMVSTHVTVTRTDATKDDASSQKSGKSF
ncbi:hypothetical protein DPSP01_000494 [Paraphaeosphaeria sporulosa]|uniref:Rhodopsin domain-containing protein n=1 Tax=Paraphaeosphaeria sporulosa TaxID=1460663 RepID=A0A177C780_9PLEO|nr:uncharacterized protein CC84DRAFT_1218907 [Paraphaeosphaeria sporulosa]OAG03604.1 hypothetical protein CC84DRAFT_1218907 [Paraphaeosphaeria sporulosa]